MANTCSGRDIDVLEFIIFNLILDILLRLGCLVLGSLGYGITGLGDLKIWRSKDFGSSLERDCQTLQISKVLDKF